MNKERRAELAEVLNPLDEATDLIQDIISEEQDTFDDLSPGLQAGKTGDSIQMSINSLECIVNDVEKVKDKITELAKLHKKR